MSTSSRTPARRPVLIEFSVAVAVLLASALLRYTYAWPGPFMVSTDWRWYSPLSYGLAAIGGIGAFLLLQRRQHRYPPPTEAENYNPSGLNQLLGLIVALTLVLLLAIPPMLLHRWSGAQPAKRIEQVRPENLGGDGDCQKRAYLVGDTSVNGLRLCIDHNEVLFGQIAASRRVEINASTSRYGTAIHNFAAAPAEEPASTR